MLRWFFLVLALLLLSLGLLTVLRAPSWLAWQLSVLAGEYGHLLALASVGLAALTWGLRGPQPGLAGLAIGGFVLAAGLLFKPTVQALRVARTLPAQLQAQFGPVALVEPAFALANLLGRDPAPVPVRTLEVAPGLPLDFYEPAGGRGGPAPCVIVVHGGGWDGGDRRQVPHFNHWLAREGFAVAAISYRLAPAHRWPAQREDVRTALAYLQRHFAELGIDPHRLVLLGRSAGGQIALATAYAGQEPAIRGTIGLYTPADLVFGYEHAHEDDMLKSPTLMRQFLGGPPQAVRANYESASPHYLVTSTTPPTLLLHGENDALVWHRHSVRLDARLAEANIPRAFVSLPWATHAFEFNMHGPGGQLTRYATLWFLRSVTAQRA